MMKKSNLAIADKDVAIGFLLFAFIKAYQERFIDNIYIIVKMGYENGLLWRYGFLVVFLSIYGFFSYFITIFILFLGYYTVILYEDSEATILLLISIYACYIFIYILTRYLFPNILRLTSTVIAYYVISGFLLGGMVIADISFTTDRTYEISLVPILFSNGIVFFIIPLSVYLDHLFRIIHFIIIYHIIVLVSPKKSLLFLKKSLNVLIPKKGKSNLLQFFITILQACFLIYFLSRINLIFSIYLSIWLILILFLIYDKHYKIVKFFLTLVISLIFLFGIEFYFESTVILEQNVLWVVIFLSMGFYVVFTFGTASYIFYKLPSLILSHFFKNWYFTKKYGHLFNKEVYFLFEAFIIERIPRTRKIISQMILNSPSPCNQKIEFIIKMGESEQKNQNCSQEVLDELARTRQSLREEQRQASLIEVYFPTAQYFFQCRVFDFIDPTILDPTITNKRTNISPIDSARQQLLNWLKGETPTNPSIDKLLIYQYQDYEIGIGLKYSGQMGGDFYDLFQLTPNANNQISIIVGDLTGHGVETALNLSKTHNFWAETDLSQDVLTTMRAFEQNFKTIFHPFPKYEGCELCYLQLKDKEITLSRAGLHLGLIRDNQWHNIAPSPDENFGSFGKWQSLPVKRYTRVELKAGEALIVYTDGLFENANQNGEQFGQDKFKQLLLQQQSLDMNTLINTVFSTVYEYCQPEPLDDDETLLVIRRKVLQYKHDSM